MRNCSLAIAALGLACVCGCGRFAPTETGAREPLADVAEPDAAPAPQSFDLASLGMDTFPGAKPGPGASSLRVPIPEGTAYTVRLRTTKEGREVLDYYEARLRDAVKLGKPRAAVVGKTRDGREATVLVDSRVIILKNLERRTESTRRYTDIVITVRSLRSAPTAASG